MLLLLLLFLKKSNNNNNNIIPLRFAWKSIYYFITNLDYLNWNTNKQQTKLHEDDYIDYNDDDDDD